MFHFFRFLILFQICRPRGVALGLSLNSKYGTGRPNIQELSPKHEKYAFISGIGDSTASEDNPLPWLSRYELVKPVVSDVSVLHSGRMHTKSVVISAFNRTFDVILYETFLPLAKNFTIQIGNKVPYSKGTTADVLNNVRIYGGKCVGRTKCTVHGQINTKKQTFEGEITILALGADNTDSVASGSLHIENYARLVGDRNITAMDPWLFVAFRKSDVIHENLSNEKSKPVSHDLNLNISDAGDDHFRKRERRDGTQGKVCYIYIIIDHRFYKAFESSVSQAVAEVRYYMTIVDENYQRADFNQDGSPDGFRIGISGIRVFQSEDDEDNIFNSKQTKVWDDNSLYSWYEMIQTYDMSAHCLGMVFTYASTKGILGLAAVPAICKERYYVYHKRTETVGYASYNVISVNVHHYNPIPKFGIVTVIAHEIGHAFGSKHDEGECKDGKYVMYRYVQSRWSDNMYDFSICSKEYINPVVIKHGTCFRDSEGTVCGNGIVEAGEECDCGDTRTCDGVDACCTPSDHGQYSDSGDVPCKFRHEQGKICSPKSSPCCSPDCKMVSADEKKNCRIGSECLDDSQCTGTSTECPSVAAKPRGSECGSGENVCDGSGKCAVSVCEYHGFKDCQCITFQADFCLVCCQAMNGTCFPASKMGVLDDDLMKPEGSVCYDECGLCDKTGKCFKKKLITPLSKIEKNRNIAMLLSKVPSREWFKNYWYYVAAGLVLLILVTVSVLFYIQNTFVSEYKTYKTGRLWKIIRQTETIKIREEKKQELVNKAFDYQIEKILRDKEDCGYRDSLSRLAIFFPTVPSDVLAKSVIDSTSEDTTMRLLLVRGYPMKPMLN